VANDELGYGSRGILDKLGRMKRGVRQGSFILGFQVGRCEVVVIFLRRLIL